MQLIILFLLTTIFISIGQSLPQARNTALLTPIEDMSSAVTNESSAVAAVVEDVSPSASNGSSLEDILKELHVDLRIKRTPAGCDFSTSTYGGRGGSAFNELPNDCGATIKTIRIHYGSYVDAIQITYRLSNGQDFTTSHHGGQGGRLSVININVDDEEKVIGVFGKKAALVDQLGFITNHGRIFGPYGGCGGSKFSVSSCHVRGVFGRSAALVDSIGFYCSRRPT